jgi:hypothetical protein
MKKHILVLFLFSAFYAQSQNWLPISAVDTYHYAIDTVDYPSHTIWVDSIEIIDDETIFYLNRIVTGCDTCNYWNKEIRKKDPWKFTGIPDSASLVAMMNQPQFLQRSIIIDKNGNYILNDPNKNFIKVYEELDSSWVLDSNLSLSAKITKMDVQNVLGNSDSIKHILLSNGDSIILSKNHGIIYFPELYKGSFNYSLIGIQNRNLGERLPTAFDVYNYDIGDRFEINSIYSTPNHSQCITKNFKVLNRSIVANEIIYEVDGFRINCLTPPPNSFLSNAPVIYDFDRMNFDMHYLFSNNRYIETSYMKINRVLISRDNSGNFKYIIGGLYDRRTDEYHDFANGIYLYLPSEGTENLLFPIGLFTSNTSKSIRVYKKGLGEVLMKEDLFESGYRKQLRGYIKNGVKYGKITPYNIVSIENENHENLLIGPNPFFSYILISSENTKEVNLTIFDVSGKTQIQSQVSTNNKIYLNNLSKGIYILKIEADSQVVFRKLIKN